jgi:hypothetical protein
MEYDFHRTPYKRRLKTIRGMSTHSLEAAKKVLKRHLQDEVLKNSTTSEVLKSLQYSTTKSSESYRTRGHGNTHMV